jgi:hypothetical protein
MAAPYTLFPIIEGVVGNIVGTASGVVSQRVAFWMKQVKELMLSDTNKDLTDFEFVALTDIDEDGSAETNSAPISTATHVYALLVGHIDDQANWVTTLDADTGTLGGELALANGVTSLFVVPACASAGVEEFTGVVFPMGLVHATGLTVQADGQDGTAPVANALRGWVLIRT